MEKEKSSRKRREKMNQLRERETIKAEKTIVERKRDKAREIEREGERKRKKNRNIELMGEKGAGYRMVEYSK